ncbi:MAG: hypothetical protein ACP5VE_07800, partial [Chthonomonadales bacterium]
VSDWLARTENGKLSEIGTPDSLQVFNLWLPCRTQEEIAVAVGYSDKTGVSKALDGLKNAIFCEIQPPDSLQVFNLWNFQTNDERSVAIMGPVA